MGVFARLTLVLSGVVLYRPCLSLAHNRSKHKINNVEILISEEMFCLVWSVIDARYCKRIFIPI